MKMKQLICPGARRIEVEEVELGLLPDDGILVQNQVTAVSIGTELWGWMGNPGQQRFNQEPQMKIISITVGPKIEIAICCCN